MENIILTGGGTAGHCTPALALIPYLKERFNNIYYIGSENGLEVNLVKNVGIEYFSVPTAKLKRSFTLKNFAIPFKVLSGIKKACKLIDELKPSVVFSKGGYVAVPVVIAAKMKKVPVISHESDYTMGLANKITGKFCKKIITSFPETASELKNGVFIGSPIREIKPDGLKKDYKHFSFSEDKPVVLCIGGSQGAKTINDNLRLALPELLPKFNIIHLCGKGNLDKSINHKGYYQAEFMHDIEKAFCITDVCISRGGANSLFELLNAQIPSVIIPLPKGESRGDQVLNANYFEKRGQILLLPQDNLTPSSLSIFVNAAYSDRFNLKRAIKEKPINDKSREIANLLFDYIRG